MRRFLILLPPLLALVMLSCATTGPGGKKDLIIISDAQEVDLGRQFDAQVRSESAVLADQQWQDYFGEVGRKIVQVCDRQGIEYHFTVIESEDINAFATPGGYVYIYTGLLKLMDSEAELAAVTAHEISHIVARHSVKRLQQALGLSVLIELATGQSDSKTLEAAIAVGLSVALSGYSRSNEREADKFGIHYMTSAGYNPQGAVTMFESMAAASPGKRNFFENMLATHPETQERIANAREQVAGYDSEIRSRDMGRTHYRQMKARLP